MQRTERREPAWTSSLFYSLFSWACFLRLVFLFCFARYLLICLSGLF